MMKSNYLFLDDGKTVGHLEQTGIFKPKVRGSMDEHRWRFVGSSSLKKGTEVAVLPLDSDEILATYHRPALRQTGSLQLGGTEYAFKVGTWKSRYTWTRKSDSDSEESEPLVTISMGGFFKSSGTVEVTDAALQLPDYQLLLVLGLYLGMDVDETNSVGIGGST